MKDNPLSCWSTYPRNTPGQFGSCRDSISNPDPASFLPVGDLAALDGCRGATAPAPRARLNRAPMREPALSQNPFTPTCASSPIGLVEAKIFSPSLTLSKKSTRPAAKNGSFGPFGQEVVRESEFAEERPLPVVPAESQNRGSCPVPATTIERCLVISFCSLFSTVGVFLLRRVQAECVRWCVPSAVAPCLNRRA